MLADWGCAAYGEICMKRDQYLVMAERYFRDDPISRCLRPDEMGWTLLFRWAGMPV